MRLDIGDFDITSVVLSGTECWLIRQHIVLSSHSSTGTIWAGINQIPYFWFYAHFVAFCSSNQEVLEAILFYFLREALQHFCLMYGAIYFSINVPFPSFARGFPVLQEMLTGLAPCSDCVVVKGMRYRAGSSFTRS